MPLQARYGKWHYRFALNGRRYSASTALAATERNRARAESKEARARAAAEDGQDPSRSRLQPREFRSAADEFLTWADAEHRDHPATARRLRTSFATLAAFFGQTLLSKLTAGQIEAYKTWRRTEHKVEEVTLRHDLHALAPFLRFCRKHGWIRHDPMAEVEIPSDAGAVRFCRITPEHERLYFETCLLLREFDLHDLGRLMILQGVRPAEALAACVADLELTRGTWRIPQSKSAAGRRTLHLTAEARSIFAARMDRAERGGGWLFPSPRKPGAHLAPLNDEHDGVLDAMRKAGHQIGEDWVLYDFRHNFATRAAARGMPLPTLAAILGHANLRTIQRYVHIAQEDMARAMQEYAQPAAELTAPGETLRLQ